MTGPSVLEQPLENQRPASAAAPVLSVTKGSKIYGGVHAIEGVDFDLYPGEVHALVGENGAGKSTLCKAIAGAIRLTSGTYCVDGKPVDFQSPRDALSAGICMVYQETSLVPTMTAAQNIELGNEKLLTRFRTLNIAAQQLLQSLNFHVDPATPVVLLGTAKRQMVEIARAIYNKARIIIFDEPTASLTPEEIRHFFNLVADLRARGVAIIYHLARARGIAEDFRPHHRAARRQAGGNGKDRGHDAREARALHGRPRHHPDLLSTSSRPGRRTRHTLEKVLTVENVTMGAMVKNMSFSVYAGEVVGIAGLIGSGRTEIAKIIFGALKRNLINGGMIYLRGKPIRYRVPKQAINDGICYITEDRKLNGFFETMRIDDNIYISRLATRRGFRFLLSRAMRSKLANYWVERLNDRGAAAQGTHRRIVGRQPAESRDRQIAGPGALDHHFRRADPGGRRRHHPADSRADPQARRRGQGGGGDLLLPAGDPRRVRPYPGGAARPHRRRIRRGHRHRAQDHVCGDPLGDDDVQSDDHRHCEER